MPTLSNMQKKQICEFQHLHKATQAQVISWATITFGLAKPITQGTVSNILKKRKSYEGEHDIAIKYKCILTSIL